MIPHYCWHRHPGLMNLGKQAMKTVQHSENTISYECAVFESNTT